MHRHLQRLVAALVVVLVCAPGPGVAQDTPQPPPLKKEQVEQLVAPIALYPDALVAQVLMAATYPLEVVSAARWAKANPGLQGKALEDALQSQPWDPSVKSLVAVPQVLAMMNEKLDWTQQLGDAFLGQQRDVLSAVQALRVKAQLAGNLKTGKEQTVVTVQEGGQTFVRIEPAQPQVVYVPVYNPTVVYGVWPYAAYPPYYYYPPGYVAGTAFVSFAAGVAVGAALWGDCDWRRGDVNINVNRYNSFNRTTIDARVWKHDVTHRRAVPYRDPATAQRYGGPVDRAASRSREQFRGHPQVSTGDLRTPGGRPATRDTAATGDLASRRDAPATRDLSRSAPIDTRAAGQRPASANAEPVMPGAFDGIGGRGADVRTEASRGRASLAGAGMAPAGRGGAGPGPGRPAAR